jgi:hypothetical protein
MGIFGRKKRVDFDLKGNGDYETDVVGESHYQSSIEKICGPRSPEGEEKEVTAQLVLEDNNRHDKEAVRVDIEGQTVGYLSRSDARSFRAELKKKLPRGTEAGTLTCGALIVGGWEKSKNDRGFYGVKLDIPHR